MTYAELEKELDKCFENCPASGTEKYALVRDMGATEQFELVHGPYDGQIVTLSFRCINTITFEALGRKGRYVIALRERTNAKDPTKPVTPIHTKLYWEPDNG